MHDAGIIDLFFDRDENALRETEEKYGRYLLKVANNVLGDAESSKECLNDAYFRAWRSIPPQRPESLRAYLSKIVRNLALNRLESENAVKRGGSECFLIFEELADALPDSEEATDKSDSEEISRAINSFLEKQDAKKRQMFVLRYFCSFSVKETAEKCGKSESAVKVALMRMRGELKAELEKGGITL